MLVMGHVQKNFFVYHTYVHIICVRNMFTKKGNIYFQAFHFQIFPAFFEWNMKWKFLLRAKIFLAQEIFPNFSKCLSQIQSNFFVYLFIFHLYRHPIVMRTKEQKRKKKLNIRTFQSLFRIWFDYMFSIAVGKEKVLILTKKFSFIFTKEKKII